MSSEQEKEKIIKEATLKGDYPQASDFYQNPEYKNFDIFFREKPPQGLSKEEEQELKDFFKQTEASKQNGLKLLFAQEPMTETVKKVIFRLAQKYTWKEFFDEKQGP